jgi:serine/threonine protein kinase
MNRDHNAAGHLLFGLLALQTGLIDQAQLVAAFHAWTRDKARPLADYLVALGHLGAAHRPLLEGLAAAHLAQHSGDAEKSLAAIPAGRSTRAGLARIADHDIEASLAYVGGHPTQRDQDDDCTTSYSVGSATSDGQRFRVLRPHAQGGLGAVFVALDTELHREVALKQILDRHADDPNSRARFLLEAEITGGLEHPGIVPVYGLGAYRDGRPYYAMRFIRGDSLKEGIAAFHADDTLRGDPGRRSVALLKLLRRFLAVCDAIDYAHSRGVLHRDLKPSNVVLGKHGETLVVDWGLAKALGRTEPGAASDERTLVPSSSSGSVETLPGSALGTPAYMSPEQASGDIEGLGPRSDVYSLGATLYCLLTGRLPFEGDDVGTVLRAVQKGDFPPPRRLDPAIDPALEAVCLKAMALRAEDRYPAPRTLAEDIEHWMADEPVAAWREPWARRARRWERRHRTAVMTAASGLLVALAGMFSVLVVQARANSELTRSNNALAAANERERARFALAMDAVKLFHGEVSEDLLLKEKPFEALRTKLLRGAADFYNRLEVLLAGQTDRPSRAALGKAYAELAELIDKIGSKPEALAVYSKALAVRRELADAPESDAASKADVARSLLAVGWIQQQTGEADRALASYAEAKGLVEGLVMHANGDEQLRAIPGVVQQRMGGLLHNTGKPAQALAALEEALAIQQKLADDHPTVVQYQCDLAQSFLSMYVQQTTAGKPAEGLAAVRRALAIWQKLADANPSVTQYQSGLASTHEKVGYALLVTGKSGEAPAAFERAVAIQRKLADANPNITRFQFDLGHNYVNLSGVLGQTGKTFEALAASESAIAILRKVADANLSVHEYQSGLAFCLSVGGTLLQKAGRTAEAAASYRQSIGVLERLPTLAPVDRYNLACNHAKLAGMAADLASRITAAEGKAEAERAMHILRQAVAAGYRDLTWMRIDGGLDPLRSRHDFQALLMDLAMPADPFAH